MSKVLKATKVVDLGSIPAEVSSLILEQKPWPGPDFFLTFNQILDKNDWPGWNLAGNSISSSIIYQQSIEEYFAQCKLNDDGSFDTIIYVFTNDPFYELIASNGTFDSDVSRVDVKKEDSVPTNLTVNYTFKYEVDDLLLAEWEGNLYNELGEIIPSPDIIFDKNTNTISWDIPVYGSIRYSILVKAYEHKLNVPIIPDSTDNKHASNILAFQNKKVVQLSVQPPDSSTDCDKIIIDIQTGIDDDPLLIVPDAPISTVPVIFNFFDYCTGEIVEATSISVDNGPLITDFITPIELLPGEHTIKVIADAYVPSDEDDLANDIFTIVVATQPIPTGDT